MNRVLKGLLAGAAAGVIDVVPMIAQKLTWDANLSAFALWVMAGFLIATSNLKLPAAVKGIVIAYAMVLPIGILVGWKEPMTLIPIGGMTLLLGAGLGWVLRRADK